MYVKEKVKTHFLNLLEDRDFASAYFYIKKLDEFDGKKLKELQEKLESTKARHKKMMPLLSIVSFLNMESLIHSVALGMESAHQQVSRAINDLDIFESNLAFLIITGIVSTEQAKKLGFSSAYIIELLEDYNKQVEQPYVEYYYDENTGRTSELTESGKMLISPYTPNVVKNELNKAKNDEKCYSRF